jgi:hypothetical protein
MSCTNCYSTVYYYVYNDVDGDQHGPNVWVTDHGNNELAAEQQAAEYYVGSSRICYYDPDNFNNVVYSKNYTWWKWFLTAWPSAFLFIMLAAVTAPICDGLGCDSDNKILAIPIWFGFILPILIFVPIALAGTSVGDSAKKGLLVAACELVWAGWFFGLIRWGQNRDNENAMCGGVVYFIFVIIPLGVLLPVGIYSTGSTKAGLIAIGVILPILSLCYFIGGDFFAAARERAAADDRRRMEAMNHPTQVVNTSSSPNHDAEMVALKARAELEKLRRENDELERRLKREHDELQAYGGPPSSAPPATAPYGGTAPAYNQQPQAVAAVAVGYQQPYAQTPPAYGSAPPPSYDSASGSNDYVTVTKQ